MTKKYLTLIFFFTCCCALAQQHSPYCKASIVPSVDSATRDLLLNKYFTYWKGSYIKKGPNKGELQVDFVDNDQRGLSATSEAEGYGMLITALIGNRDTLDRLYAFTQHRPATPNLSLMSWAQKKNGKSGKNTATDGDLDIAYALLLAARRWPEKADYYRAEARKMCADIWAVEVNKHVLTLQVGNSESITVANPNEGIKADTSNLFFATRSSDFMPATLKAFDDELQWVGQPWHKLVDNEYILFNLIQRKYADWRGIVPDYIQKVNDTVDNVPNTKIAESKHDGDFYDNACRVPWRIGVDFLQNGDRRAFMLDSAFNVFIQHISGNQAEHIYRGYTMNGVSLNTDEEYFFVAPAAVAAMCQPNNQKWLDQLWAFMQSGQHFTKRKVKDYFGESINMICMIIVSGHYWPAYNQH